MTREIKEKLIFLVFIIVGLIIGIFWAQSEIKDTQNNKIDISISTKTYKDGLYEGSNETLKYLFEQNLISKDIIIEQKHSIDSVLNLKLKNR